MILVDSCVLLDVIDNEPLWSPWSSTQLNAGLLSDQLFINAIVYAEIAPSFAAFRDLDQILAAIRVSVMAIPREAAFLASRAYQEYRRRGGAKSNVLPDFFIGAHAAVLGAAILTRDTRRYAAYFPMVRLIAP